MNDLSTQKLARAREAVNELLESLDLGAFWFELSPTTEGGWRLRVEAASNGAWETITLNPDPDRLLATLDDPETRRAMAAELRRALGV